GVGIPESLIPNLFKPFYTTKSKGLGLGLAYSLKAVEAHGGRIEVESQVGKGTTFKIVMPLRPSPVATGATA
ncbi:MAG: ATP-binding protein, partial [bacterium]|nr:ATP-binding protein [bacterium]